MSREKILTAIRTSEAAAARSKRATSNELHARWSHPAHTPDYQRTGALSRPACIALFAERIHEYDGHLERCSSRAGVPDAVAGILQQEKRKTLAVPAGLPPELLPTGTGFTFLRDAPPLSNAQLNGCDGVITRATVAVAVSGSVALQHGPEEGRRVLTLLPDFHLCILLESELVETLPEALARMQATAARPTTFFSGPSATADIEMTRIKGVHGPRFLAVLLVPDSSV